MDYLNFMKQALPFIIHLLLHFFLFHTKPLSNEQQFKIASYNVENLFDLKRDGNEYAEYEPFQHDWNLNSFHSKLKNISNVIKEINPDIIALCEIENLNALTALQKELRIKGIKYSYFAIGDTPNKSTVNVAILSKYKITNSKTIGIPKSGKYFTRNILESDIIINNSILKVFALHLPSKRKPESKRVEVLKILSKRLNALPINCDYIIAGDLNSNYNESEIFYTTGHDNTQGYTGINHVLNTVLSPPNEPICYYSPHYLIKDSTKSYHYIPWLEVNPEERFSYVYKGSKNTLDHIILSEGLFDQKGFSYVDSSFKPFRWSGLLMENNEPYRWQMIRNKKGRFHIGEGYSDHLPVLLSITTSPYISKKVSRKRRIHYNTSTLCNFESGVEGWIITARGFYLSLDNTAPHKGSTCLEIQGKSPKNTTIAKCSIKPSANKKKTISLWIKGKGKIVFCLKQKDKKTVYFYGINFSKHSPSPRYEAFLSKEWREIFLKIPTDFKNSKTDLTIKTYKNYPMNISLDNIEIR